METRCDPLKIKKTFMHLGFDSMEYSRNIGFAGGIVIAWKSNDISIQVCKKDNQFIHTKVSMEHVRDGWLTAIYASPKDNRKKLLWEEMKNIVWDMKEGWMLGGEFNDISSVSEKKVVCQLLGNDVKG